MRVRMVNGCLTMTGAGILASNLGYSRPAFVLETKRNDFFVQTFSVESRPLDQPSSIKAAEFVEYLLSLKNPYNHILLAGDGVGRALGYVKDKPANLILTLDEGYGGPQAWDIATLVKSKFKSNQSFPVPKPLYLRQPDVTKQKV